MEAVEAREFEARVLEARVPVVLVFTAEWCAPCRWLYPHLEDLGSQADGRFLIYEVDTDRSPELAQRFAVASLPTVLLIRGGAESERSLGVEPERLRAWVSALPRPQSGS